MVAYTPGTPITAIKQPWIRANFHGVNVEFITIPIITKYTIKKEGILPNIPKAFTLCTFRFLIPDSRPATPPITTLNRAINTEAKIVYFAPYNSNDRISYPHSSVPNQSCFEGGNGAPIN